MKQQATKLLSHIDWAMFLSALCISLAGLITMNSFQGSNIYFERQLIWISVSVLAFFVLSFLNFHFLRRTSTIVALFVLTTASLIAIFIFGEVVKGAQSRFDFGIFAVQPSDPAKLVIVALLAKYFTRRHIEIAHIRHILVSGIYAFIIFALILMQPDFGSAIMVLFVWFGMVLVSGISKKHLALVFLAATIGASALWGFALHDYQKQRIITFISPLTDLHGSGYNAHQSMIAVGSGGLLGKGIGYGTQSKLRFLPEYQTDFIFASFAEEWGFVGVTLFFSLFGILIWRILAIANLGTTNFETLFCIGVAILFVSHFTVHIGMNIGLLPVTGVTLPFTSYGGSHLLTGFAALGIINAMRRYSRTINKAETENEFLGT